MTSRTKVLEFTKDTDVLFFYHNGFSTDLLSFQIRILKDFKTEIVFSQMGADKDIKQIRLPLEIQGIIVKLLNRKSSSYSQTVFESFIEDLGGGSIQCRFGDLQVIRFQVEEPVTEANMPAPETELLSLYKALRDFGLSSK